MGSRGDSYDNALAETTIGLYKTELINGRSWLGPQHLERETLAYIDWYNRLPASDWGEDPSARPGRPSRPAPGRGQQPTKRW